MKANLVRLTLAFIVLVACSYIADPSEVTIPDFLNSEGKILSGEGFRIALPTTYIGGSDQQSKESVFSFLEDHGWDRLAYEDLEADVFFACDTHIDSSNGYITQLFISSQTLPASKTLPVEDMAEVVVNDWVKKGRAFNSSSLFKIRNYPAYRIIVSDSVTGEQEDAVYFIHYIVKIDEILWSIIFVTRDDVVDRRQTDFDMSAQSFLLGD